MRNAVRVFHLFCFLLSLSACRQPDRFATLRTDFGEVRVRLFGDVPEGCAIFEQLTEGTDTVFVHSFVRDKWMTIRATFPEKWPEKWHPLEKEAYPPTGRPHVRGALSVVNFPKSDTMPPPLFQIVLDPSSYQAFRQLKGEQDGCVVMPPRAAEVEQEYIKKGGQPGWDYWGTVFGEVVEGMDVLDRIAAMPTDGEHRPLRAVPVKFSWR